MSAADQQRLAGLRRMRAIALSLLVAAAILFLVTLGHPMRSWQGFVNAAAGAAMVGALADWFAVTALFRHPLGIPVPHTALIPRRKSELGRSLQDFVAEHFLTEAIARDRVTGAQITRRFGVWLTAQPNRRRVLDGAAQAGTAVLERIPDAEVQHFVEDVVAPRLSAEPIAPLAGELLDQMVRDRAHYGLVDLALAEIHSWLKENPNAFMAVVADRAPWWSPVWVDEKVVSWTYNQAIAWITDIQADRGHQTRRALDGMLLRLAQDLQHDAAVQERAEALKSRLLEHPQVGVTAVSLWRSAKRAMIQLLADPESTLHGRGDEWLVRLSSRLERDAELRDRIDGYLGDAAAFAVRNYGPEMAQAISHTIDNWDGQDAAKRIELHVGRDLQFIRINGTVVGALAGLVIHTVGVLLS